MRSYGWHFVTRLKRNRAFNGQKFARRWPHRFGHAQGQLTGGIAVLVVKDGGRFLASSDLSLDVRQVKALYAQRQQVEEFFKVMRDCLRWQQCPARTKAAQTAHLHLCALAFLALQEEAVSQQTTVYQVRRQLFRQEVPRQTPLLERITLAA